MANEGVDWALSFADGAERADDGPDVTAQAPGPASTQRAGAKEKASQEPKTVRPRTRPVPACFHPRSRVFPPTFPRVSTHDAPLTANSRGLHHPPAAFAALSVIAHFFSRGDLTRAFFRGEGAFLNRKIHR